MELTHPLTSAIETLTALRDRTKQGEARADLGLAIGIMEQYREEDAKVMPAMRRLAERADVIQERREELAGLVGLPADAELELLLQTAANAVRTLQECLSGEVAA